MRRPLSPAARALLPLASAAAALGLWTAAVAATSADTFPSPLAVARGIGELARRGVLAAYVGDSLRRVASGYLLALAVGLPIGLLLGFSPLARRVVEPVIQFLRPISPLAWIPVAIVLFGISDGAAVFLIFLAAVFPIALATTNGVLGVPEMLLRAGRNFGLGPLALAWRVVVPAALPEVLGALRIALGIAWLVVVAAEMIAVDSGLGYLVIDARNAGKRYDLVVAAMLMIGVIGLALDLLARRIERLRPVRWAFPRDA